MTMKVHAHAADEPGSELEPFTYEIDQIDAFDCVVEVEACGLCRSDLHMLDDDWQMSDYPLVPGHEIVGHVVELGGEVDHLEVGQRVGIGWQKSSCLHCQDCLRGDENLCDEAAPLIAEGFGGFADYVEADARFCFPLPDAIETEKAGPLLCGGITVYSALKEAGMAPGSHVGIVGVGGLGHLAVQFADALGSRVTVFTSSEDKADFAADLGADEVVVSSGSAPGAEPDRRIDVLLNTAPITLDWPAYIDLLDTDGTLCIVGAPEEPLEFPAQSLMFKRRRLMGSVIGGRAAINEMLQTAADFDIAPIVETFPMEKVNTAIEALRRHEVRYRAVLTA